MELTKYKKMLKEIKKEANNKHKEIEEKYLISDNSKDKNVEKA